MPVGGKNTDTKPYPHHKNYEIMTPTSNTTSVYSCQHLNKTISNVGHCPNMNPVHHNTHVELVDIVDENDDLYPQ